MRPEWARSSTSVTRLTTRHLIGIPGRPQGREASLLALRRSWPCSSAEYAGVNQWCRLSLTVCCSRSKYVHVAGIHGRLGSGEAEHSSSTIRRLPSAATPWSCSSGEYAGLGQSFWLDVSWPPRVPRISLSSGWPYTSTWSVDGPHHWAPGSCELRDEWRSMKLTPLPTCDLYDVSIIHSLDFGLLFTSTVFLGSRQARCYPLQG